MFEMFEMFEMPLFNERPRLYFDKRSQNKHLCIYIYVDRLHFATFYNSERSSARTSDQKYYFIYSFLLRSIHYSHLHLQAASLQEENRSSLLYLPYYMLVHNKYKYEMHVSI